MCIVDLRTGDIGCSRTHRYADNLKSLAEVNFVMLYNVPENTSFRPLISFKLMHVKVYNIILYYNVI